MFDLKDGAVLFLIDTVLEDETRAPQLTLDLKLDTTQLEAHIRLLEQINLHFKKEEP